MTDLSFMQNEPEKLSAARIPTPIIRLNRYFPPENGYHVWLKRDDLTGSELSGNKIRKLEYLMQEAIHQHADHVITCGGLQSNHCRATAFLAVQYGLKPVLVLRGERPSIAYGNYFLDRLSGATVEFVTPEVYARSENYMEEYANSHQGNFYIIPEGGSNALGAWGYLNCYQEILRQDAEMGLGLDTIVVATGSGGTHAGLLLGKLLLNGKIDVVSVNVCDSADYFRNRIASILEQFGKSYATSIGWNKKDIHIIDGFVGEGYGRISETEIQLIKDFSSREGVILDPVYGAKAFAGMAAYIREERLPGKHILFIHTGGIFGIFPLWDRFLT